MDLQPDKSEQTKIILYVEIDDVSRKSATVNLLTDSGRWSDMAKRRLFRTIPRRNIAIVANIS